MKRFEAGLFMSVILFFLLLISATAADAVTLSRNGNFNSGLDQWNINPAITSTTWIPLVTHATTGNAVNLHPEAGFNGTVIYQNLKVTGIAGATFDLSARLTQNFAPPGNTIALYLVYVDNADAVHKIKVLNPDNATITSDTPVSGSYTFPADARKLVKLEVVKETSGEFIIDNIVLSTSATVTTAPLPLVEFITPSSSPYGSVISIDGKNFTATMGQVTVGGSSTGMTIDSWTGTSIKIILSDPAQSGEVNVISDFVESNIDKKIDVTSPNYSVSIVENKITVIKGETAEFVIGADFFKGFTTAGISFSIEGSAALSSRATFLHTPLKTAGGALLRINTSTLAKGIYTATLKAVEGSSAPRYATFTLEVVTINAVKWYVLDLSSNKTYITSKTISQQGQITGIFVEAIDSNGTDRGYQADIQSGNTLLLPVFKMMFGTSMYANDSGSVTLTASTPDGKSAALAVTISISNPKITSLSVSSPVSNTDTTSDLYYSATSSDTLTWIGYETSGMIDFGITLLDNIIYAPDYLSASSTFNMSVSPSDLGTVIVYAMTTGDAKRVAPLEIVNGASTAGAKGAVKIVDSFFAEVFLLELYSTSTNVAYSKQLFLMHGDGKYTVGGIPPGTYRIRISSPAAETQKVDAQWYPNARNYASAQPVTFTAGQNAANINFFLREKSAGGPQIEVSPTGVNFGNVNIGASNSTGKVTIYNRGTSSLTISSITITGPNKLRFSQTSSCSSVAVNGSCIVNLTFTPNTVGSALAYLTIQSNDADAPLVDVMLNGTGAIAAPSAITVKATGPSSMVVGWKDNSGNETGFRIERKPGLCADAGTWTEIGTVGANIITYTNAAGLTANTAYSYRVRAYNAAANSNYTACASASTGPAGTPDSPAGLKATAQSSTSAALAWTYADTDSPDFRIYRKTASGSTFVLIGTVKTKSFTDNSSGANYSYYVKSCNAGTTQCSPQTSTAVVPVAPGGLNAAAASSTEVDLSWTDNSTNETGFQVMRKAGNCASANAWVLIKTLAADTTAFSNTGLASGQTYSYQVRSYIQSATQPFAYGYSGVCQSVTTP